LLPTLTVNGTFMREFVSADALTELAIFSQALEKV